MRVKRLPARKSHVYLRKSTEFLRAAEASLSGGDWNAAGLGAVHAGISAVDAVTTWMLGERSRDADHERSSQLVRRTGLDDADDRAEQFVRLIRDKNLIEYEAREYEAHEAEVATKRARRLVAWADSVVAGESG